MLTRNEAKEVVQKLARECHVRYNLIISRLLSDQDKDDLCNGLIEISSLKCHIEAWRDNGMPNYAKGLTVSLKEESRKELYDQC